MKTKVFEVTSQNQFGELLNECKRNISTAGVFSCWGNRKNISFSFFEHIYKNIGEVSNLDVTSGEQVEGNLVHRVEVAKNTVFDKYGFQPYSTTNVPIPCHTEDFFEKDPCDLVIFYCVRRDSLGGKTLIAFLDEILSQLSESDVTYLQKPIFPTYYGETPILIKENGNFRIKYSRVIIDKALKATAVKHEESMECLGRLDSAIEKVTHQMMLKENQLIVYNNKNALHGRTGFNKSSRRLLYRVKIKSYET